MSAVEVAIKNNPYKAAVQLVTAYRDEAEGIVHMNFDIAESVRQELLNRIEQYRGYLCDVRGYDR